MATVSPFIPKPVTDIFTTDTSIDRSKCKRTVPMKVLVLGLGRTGTASIRAALKRLGYIDTYHMMSTSVENPPDCAYWKAAFEAKYESKGEKLSCEQWDQLLGHCQAVCDWPAACFGKELVEAYPEAKVILPTRNVDAWHKSTMKTVNWRVNDSELRWLSYVDWGAGYYYPMLRKMFDTFFRGDFEKHGKDVFREHYKEMRTIVPPENLLEYEVSQGWEPLCRFLGQCVPSEQFPQGNDVCSFVERTRLRNRMQACNVALRVLINVAIIASFWLLFSKVQLSFGYCNITFTGDNSSQPAGASTVGPIRLHRLATSVELISNCWRSGG